MLVETAWLTLSGTVPGAIAPTVVVVVVVVVLPLELLLDELEEVESESDEADAPSGISKTAGVGCTKASAGVDGCCFTTGAGPGSTERVVIAGVS